MTDRLTEPGPVPPLNGLIAAGGHSVRMGREKGGLAYGDRPQVRRLYDQLTPDCREVYVSIRDEQSERSWCEDLPRVYDLFDDLGPVSGLLSAMIRSPDTAWLFVACDMPLVDQAALRRLMSERDPNASATVYQRSASDPFEPVFGIYEPDFRTAIREALGRGTSSLQQMLRDADVRTVRPRRNNLLTSVDRPSEFHQLKRSLRGARYD